MHLPLCLQCTHAHVVICIHDAFRRITCTEHGDIARSANARETCSLYKRGNASGAAAVGTKMAGPELRDTE